MASATGAVRGPQDNTVHLALVALAEVSASQLEEFQPQELSMVAWSLAKLYESKRGECFDRSRRGRCASRPFVVDDMLLRLAGVATQCIDRFEDQGISNIAWAMATLELTGAQPAMAPVRADVGWPWRMDWGGHDPASPIAEMHINYHNTGWGIMIFVCTTVFYLMTKR